VLVTGYIVDERSKVEDMIKRYNEAVKTLSIFEGELAEQHEADLKREARIKRERETEAKLRATLPETAPDGTPLHKVSGSADQK